MKRIAARPLLWLAALLAVMQKNGAVILGRAANCAL
jgi:hypothetical protein